MNKYIHVAVCAAGIALMSAPSGAAPATNPGPAASIERNSKLILGAWYCPEKDQWTKIEFLPNGARASYSYFTIINTDIRYWAPLVIGETYQFSSPTVINTNDPSGATIIVKTLNSAELKFATVATWGQFNYSCSRTPPPDDTPAMQAVAARTREEIDRSFIGKWVSVDGTESVEFLNGHACIFSRLDRNRWLKFENKSSVSYDRAEIVCGVSNFHQISPNTLERFVCTQCEFLQFRRERR